MENDIIVGISGASGVIHSLDFCASLKSLGFNPIVVMTKAAEKVGELENETVLSYELRKLKLQYYDETDIGASIASGSFKTCGMVVYPCSISSLSKIAYSTNTNLLIRAADVTLKERRKLILVVRETPFHIGHLKLMERVCEMGAVVMPLVFSFYSHENKSVADHFRQFNGRVFDQLGIKNNLVKRWGEKTEEDKIKKI